MQRLNETRTLSVSIERDADEVYAFLSAPENFPKWASGLGQLRKDGTDWITETPEGPMKIRFSQRNEFGILDHWLFPASDKVIYIPMRVVKNGTGCLLTFILFRLSAMTQDKFEADAEWVMRDLQAAKQLLESNSR